MVNLKKRNTIREKYPNYDNISYEEQLKKEYAHLQKDKKTPLKEMKPQYNNRDIQNECEFQSEIFG